jgi:MoaA/NifB/PqqE/SkfB family radical SAM enzyme/ADP-ribose pyrophosphatase YjhB (NUDIX family)
LKTFMRISKIADNEYTIRDEPFGFTLYNHSTLTHQFLKKEQLKPYLRTNSIKHYTYLPAKKKNYRQDILYSPIRVYYEVTLACNLRCKFCFNNSGKSRKNELTTEEIIYSLRSLRKDNVIDLRFTGGEITCRPDWYEILKTAKDLGFVVSCNTNAIFTDSTIVPKLASLNLDQITISIDGTEKHHDENRGHGSYRRTLENLDLLHKSGAKLRVNTLLSRLTIHDLEPLLKVVSKYIDEINFFPVRFIGRGEDLEPKYSITLAEFYDFKLEADSIKKEYPNLNLLTFAKANRRASINKEENGDLGLRIGTSSGITSFNITSDGGLWAGGYLPYIDNGFELGNINKESIFNVWQNSNKLETLRNQAQKLKEYCYKCKENKKRCPGTIFELETYRQIKPKTKNYYCIYGQGEPLLDKLAKKLPYRNNVGAIVFKGDKYLLVQRTNWPGSFWKFPQGGVNEGENKEKAVMRELNEELGTNKFKIIKHFSSSHKYNWDRESINLANFRWRGQRQFFFLVEFIGGDINLNSKELKNYCWVTKKELLKKINHDHPIFTGYKKFIKKLLS